MHEMITPGDRARIDSGRAARCPDCGHVIGIGIPSRGTPGDPLRFYMHGPDGARCPGAWKPATGSPRS